ncbi:MAG: hypothetical protein IH933_11535 [Euryarchaeota archaeon]|nr:hypothetical protein [Euryarchaeota archaeon]
MRTALTRNGGSLADAGSVSYMFSRKGVVLVPQTMGLTTADVYAEAPEDGYLPAAGTLTRVIEPVGPGIRVDSGVHAGTEISVHFDPMLSKIIVYGQDRETACQRMSQALRHSAYLGIPTNLDFLMRIIDSRDFRAAELRTDFLDLHPEIVKPPAAETEPPDAAYVAAALTEAVGEPADDDPDTTGRDKQPEVWDTLGPIRLWRDV